MKKTALTLSPEEIKVVARYRLSTGLTSREVADSLKGYITLNSVAAIKANMTRGN